MTAVYIAGVALIIFLILLAGPLLFGRLFLPRLTFSAINRFGKWVARLTNRIKPGLDIKLLVKAVNHYFHDRFAATPFSERVLFLPFCLRPTDCPAEIDPERGVMCTGGCRDCELGRVRDEALEMGYAEVIIVPSSRMVKDMDLMPSDQFIKTKLRELSPKAAIGVVCDWHLRHRLLPGHKVGGQGYIAGKGRDQKSVLQGVLLDCKSCKQANVDWNAVRRQMSVCSC